LGAVNFSMEILMNRSAFLSAALALLFFPIVTATSSSAVGEGENCGGPAGIACDAGLFCEHPPGMCGVLDGSGVCEKKPKACTDHHDPVCACPEGDAKPKEYSNDCYRKMDGAQLDYASACGDKPVEE
jgi:hypothetical protein